ncbi:MAG: YlmC/YmxH family sporulation protein [Lachnospiraceae bacterium]|nr:YlmC/YmxH family sporulation protein [Lachnospiraceae bacterium]
MLFSELKSKSVINIRDCKCLGKVCDLEFDEKNGCILKVIIPKGGGFCNFFKSECDYEICYRDIKQIGPDIILVDICF